MLRRDKHVYINRDKLKEERQEVKLEDEREEEAV